MSESLLFYGILAAVSPPQRQARGETKLFSKIICEMLAYSKTYFYLCQRIKTKSIMEKKIQKIFKDNDISYDYDICKDNIVVVHVEWGDWKHEHGYLDYVMEHNGFKLLHEQLTEEDGSDCYSADHIYQLHLDGLYQGRMDFQKL